MKYQAHTTWKLSPITRQVWCGVGLFGLLYWFQLEEGFNTVCRSSITVLSARDDQFQTRPTQFSAMDCTRSRPRIFFFRLVYFCLEFSFRPDISHLCEARFKPPALLGFLSRWLARRPGETLHGPARTPACRR